MSNSYPRRFPLCILLLVLASCASNRGGITDGPPVAFKPISYHRTGGLMGADDRLSINPDGHVDIVERDGRIRTKQLTQEQIDYLINLFEGWDKLKRNYPAPRGAADYFEYEVKYGDKTVTGTEASGDAPPELSEIWANLAAIAR